MCVPLSFQKKHLLLVADLAGRVTQEVCLSGFISEVAVHCVCTAQTGDELPVVVHHCQHLPLSRMPLFLIYKIEVMIILPLFYCIGLNDSVYVSNSEYSCHCKQDMQSHFSFERFICHLNLAKRNTGCTNQSEFQINHKSVSAEIWS